MGDKSAIEWTEATWNPLRGCSRVSEGCRNCYAERVAARFSGPGDTFEGVARMTDAGPRWTGDIRLVEHLLDLPLRWRRPRRIFVNSMSDLFHEQVKDEWIAAIFAVMLLAGHHTYQVLTKRPERMRDWMQWLGRQPDPADILLTALGDLGVDASVKRAAIGPWPKPHIWLGVSVEDQATANERIPLLLQTPAALRWVSYEPALGPVDFKPRPRPRMCLLEHPHDGPCPRDGLGWIVVGGESGPGARPFDLAWARHTVEQGRAAGVPVFVKQLGARPWDGISTAVPRKPSIGCGCREALCPHVMPRPLNWLRLRDRKGGDPAEWPEDLRVREYPR